MTESTAATVAVMSFVSGEYVAFSLVYFMHGEKGKAVLTFGLSLLMAASAVLQFL
jgi:hypothetical protein